MPKKGKDPRIENAQVHLNFDEPVKLMSPVFDSIYDIMNPKEDSPLPPPGPEEKELTDYGNDREDPQKI